MSRDFVGSARYNLALAKAIARNRGKHEVIVLFGDTISQNINEIRLEFDGILHFENIKVWRGLQKNFLLPDDCINRKLSNEILRESFVANLKPDIVHIFSIFDGFEFEVSSSVGKFYKDIKTSVTFYDAIPFIYPEQYLNNRMYRKFYLENLII